MSTKADVIIVGSGPAGGSAAFFLGEGGMKVVILEKAHLPRYKTCGGAVSLEVLQQFPFSFEPVIQSKVKAITYSVSDKMVTVPLKRQTLCMVMRDEFDATLVKHAKAELLEGSMVVGVKESSEGVQVETRNGQYFEAKYLIGADGANSTVARLCNLRRQKEMAGAIEIEARVPPEVLQRYASRPVLIFGDVGTGYSWIFPKADHVSVGVGALNPHPGQLQAVLDREMGRFGIQLDGQERHGHPVPIYLRPERISTRRVLLAGDAAGLVEPLTGEGIRFAIKSGRLAAESILAGRPEQYARLVDRRIGRNHRMGVGLSSIFFPLVKPFFQLVLRNPVLTQALVRMVDDRSGYGRLMLAITGTLPYYLLAPKIPLGE